MGLQVRAVVLGAVLTSLVVPVVVDQQRAAASAPAESSVTSVTFAAVRTVEAVPASSARPAVATPSCPAGLVALTFDDGPARGLTVRLVQLLQRLHVPATFFMVGSRVRTAPYGAKVVVRAGFPVGNHTWSHPHLTRLSDAAIRSEIVRTAVQLRRVGVPRTPLMRPPYGDINRRVRADVRALRLVPVLWNVDSNDWRGGSAYRISTSILRQLRPHRSNIVLQHDGVRNSPASVAAVPRVVRVARRRGFCFTHLGPDGRMAPLPPPVEPTPTPAPEAGTPPARVGSFDVAPLLAARGRGA